MTVILPWQICQAVYFKTTLFYQIHWFGFIVLPNKIIDQRKIHIQIRDRILLLIATGGTSPILRVGHTKKQSPIRVI